MTILVLFKTTFKLIFFEVKRMKSGRLHLKFMGDLRSLHPTTKNWKLALTIQQL